MTCQNEFSVLHRGVRLLEMGSVELGGSGCICPESAMLKTLFTHLLFRKDDMLILDMYAGVEHLGRATVDFVDAHDDRGRTDAPQPGHGRADQEAGERHRPDAAVAGREQSAQRGRSAFLEAETPGIPVLGMLPADLAVQEADRLGIAVYDHVPALRGAAEQMAAKLAEVVAELRRIDNTHRGNIMTTTIALAGKGGVGKTTIAGMVIKYLCQNQPGAILAIDADPSSNLNMVLGLDLEWTVGDIREDMLDQVKESLTAGGAAMGTLQGGVTKRELSRLRNPIVDCRRGAAST